ncbi:tetratricopeptide repeat protein [Pseudomonas viridiflava]|uniref:tetratricopeptide repeat protein n=1 Tax=Pseudomonas viridiflava TaxID=33069 RepID=UPI001BCD4934|nr:tetratricopeptide repeat protein [Pseudomonas viridiflava]QVI86992.1 sel1 repeat family protein [Pseudomonas viridiflava]
MRNLAAIFCAIFLVACKPPTFEDGWAAIKAKDKPKAIVIFTPLADKGDVRAQTELGVIYKSDGFKDPQKAFKYYKLAADQGQMWGNYMVGDAYKEGKGVEKNLGYAEQQYLKAAKEGLVLAMRGLTSLYQQNNLLSYSDSPIQIRRWALAAFERGDSLSANEIKNTYPYGSLDYVAWNNAYPDICLKDGRNPPTNYVMMKPDAGKEIAILAKHQEILRLFKHIEPPTIFPWR